MRETMVGPNQLMQVKVQKMIDADSAGQLGGAKRLRVEPPGRPAQ